MALRTIAGLALLRLYAREPLPGPEFKRPKWRSQCRLEPGERPQAPCPYVGCRSNLYLEVTPLGHIRINRPDLEPWEIPPEESCAEDAAEEGERTLEEVGRAIGLTRERARQIIEAALLRAGPVAKALGVEFPQSGEDGTYAVALPKPETSS